MQRSDYGLADKLFRDAWSEPSLRSSAAAGLSRLHKLPGFKLPVDEAAVRTALEQVGPRFSRTDTPHFVILSDCDRRWVQGRADLLERTRTQFLRVAGKLQLHPCPPSTRLLCILFDKHEEYLAFASRDALKSPWMAGYFSARNNRVVFYNQESAAPVLAARERLARARRESRQTRDQAQEARSADNPDLADRLLAAADDLDRRIAEEQARVSTLVESAAVKVTIHEAVHLLAFNTGVQRRDREYPFWLSEGLATAFQTDSPRAAFGPDRRSSGGGHVPTSSTETSGGLPISDLIAVIDPNAREPEVIEVLYRQSLELFTHLYAKDGRAIAGYLQALNSRPPGPWTPAQHTALFAQHFGDPLEIQRRMAR